MTRISDMTTQRLAAASCALGLLAYAGLTTLFSVPEASAFDDGGPPAQIELTGVARDFRERTVAMGHPDFEVEPDHGVNMSELLTLNTFELSSEFVYDPAVEQLFKFAGDDDVWVFD